MCAFVGYCQTLNFVVLVDCDLPPSLSIVPLNFVYLVLIFHPLVAGKNAFGGRLLLPESVGLITTSSFGAFDPNIATEGCFPEIYS